MLVAILVALATTAGIRALHARENRLREEQAILYGLEALVQTEESDQWEAMARHGIFRGLTDEEHRLESESSAQIQALARLEGITPEVASLRRAYDRCHIVLDREAQLVAAGRYRDADGLDTKQGDPAFDEMGNLCRDIGGRFGAAAERASLLAEGGTCLVLLLSIAGLVLFQRFAHARYSAAVLESERRSMRESEERFQALFQNAMAGLYRTSPAGIPLLANTTLLDMLDYSSVEELTANIAGPEYEEAMALRALFLAELDLDTEVRGREAMWKRRDGTPLWVRESAKAIRNAEGQTVCYEGSVEDVTDRKLAEEAMWASEDRLSRIVETNADGILLLDPQGNITLANAATERILGVDRAEILRKRCADIWTVQQLDGTPIPAERQPFQNVMATAAAVSGVEMVVVSPTGARLILSCNAAPLRDAANGIAGVVMSLSDITQRKTLEERLMHQAFHDPLTGLPNRTLFLDRLTKALERADRSPKPLAALFVDLDNFKLINDSLGHAMGDRLLVAVAQRLQRSLRSGDTGSRFGGDEFTVLLDGVTDAKAAMETAQRLSDELQKPFILGTREVVITPSIGVAITGLDAITADELLRNADAAMYAAKTHGKARVTLFQSTMNAHSLRRLEMENDLRRAMERGELVVYYQPEVAVEGGQVLGVEALVRWQHPERGIIQPSDFIPLAEETGLIVPIGRWVLRQACRQGVEWQDAHPRTPALIVAVNLSAKQFQDAELVSYVAETLAETGLDPHCLTLEITESVVMDEAEMTIVTLQALKDLGVRLAIDDFGTGYSSLSYLKRFPMDFVKIDRSFVDGLGRDADDMLIVSATISLAHALGLTVVAEGAENQAQVAALRRLGCDVAQGFCYARPLTVEQAGAFLKDHTASPSYPVDAQTAP